MTHPVFSGASFMAAPGEVADWRLVLLYDAACGTGLADVLPATVDEAARRGGLEPTAVRAVLDALVAGGIATRAADGTVALIEEACDPGRRAQLRQHASTLRRWSTGIEPRLRGEEAPLRAPFNLKGWLESMAVNAASQADAIAEAALARVAVAGGARRALDLGGGHGRYAMALAARGLEVVMQDRADVVALVEAEGWLAGTGVQTVAGDFHDSLPDGPFDVVLAVGIMHTMAPERAASLLRRVAEAMAPGAVLAIRTMLRDADATSALFAVQMLVAGQGGDAHRLEDYRRWLRDAGLDGPVVQAVGNGALLLATKP